jgi:hypothetical protein
VYSRNRNNGNISIDYTITAGNLSSQATQRPLSQVLPAELPHAEGKQAKNVGSTV